MNAPQEGFIARVVGVFVKSKVTPLIIGFSIFLGVMAVINLPREEEPQISVPMFDIFVSYPGATAEEVERRIVNVGERKLWEINGVEYVMKAKANSFLNAQPVQEVNFEEGETPNDAAFQAGYAAAAKAILKRII